MAANKIQIILNAARDADEPEEKTCFELKFEEINSVNQRCNNEITQCNAFEQERIKSIEGDFGVARRGIDAAFGQIITNLSSCSKVTNSRDSVDCSSKLVRLLTSCQLVFV